MDNTRLVLCLSTVSATVLIAVATWMNNWNKSGKKLKEWLHKKHEGFCHFSMIHSIDIQEVSLNRDLWEIVKQANLRYAINEITGNKGLVQTLWL